MPPRTFPTSTKPGCDFPCSLPICSLGNQKRQRFGDQGWLLGSLHLQRVLGLHDHLPAFPRLDPGEHDAQPHARTSRHWCQKADLLDPVVQPGGGIARDDANLHRERRHHRQRQIAMRDRTAERTFPLRPFNVDMNPLAIAGAGSKRLDERLIDSNPIRNTELPSNVFAQTGKCKSAHLVPPLLAWQLLSGYISPYFSRNSFLFSFTGFG